MPRICHIITPGNLRPILAPRVCSRDRAMSVFSVPSDLMPRRARCGFRSVAMASMRFDISFSLGVLLAEVLFLEMMNGIAPSALVITFFFITLGVYRDNQYRDFCRPGSWVTRIPSWNFFGETLILNPFYRLQMFFCTTEKWGLFFLLLLINHPNDCDLFVYIDCKSTY